MTKNELQKKLLANANRIASSRSFRNNYLIEKDDLRSELVLHALNIMNSGKLDMNNEPEHYLNKAMSNKAKTLTSNLFNNKTYFMATGNFCGELSDNSETVEETLIYKELKNKVYITVDKIKFLCNKFGVVFDEESPIKSVKELCDLTLNRMSDDAFSTQTPEIQELVAEIGEYLSSGDLRVVLKSISKQRSRHYISVKDIIREAMSMNIIKSDDIYKYLVKQNIKFNRSSVRIMCSNVRREMGIHKERKNVYHNVKEIFAKNPNIHIKELQDNLCKRRIEFNPTTSMIYLTKLRREHKESEEKAITLC